MFGQAQVDGGVVIDSSTLNSVRIMNAGGHRVVEAAPRRGQRPSERAQDPFSEKRGLSVQGNSIPATSCLFSHSGRPH